MGSNYSTLPKGFSVYNEIITMENAIEQIAKAEDKVLAEYSNHPKEITEIMKQLEKAKKTAIAIRDNFQKVFMGKDIDPQA